MVEIKMIDGIQKLLFQKVFCFDFMTCPKLETSLNDNVEIAT